MEEIILFINDLNYSPILTKEVDTISFIKGQLIIHLAYVGVNGIGDTEVISYSINEDISFIELYEVIDSYYDNIIEIDDLLLNDGLIEYYLKENNKDHLKEIDDYYIKMLTHDWKNKKDEDDFVTLAISFQSYGHFLKRYDFPRCIDAYNREKDLLEQVATLNPCKDNKLNELVGYEDLINAYEHLGKDFEKECLNLYLTLYEKRKVLLPADYYLGHLAEKIGMLYDKIDTTIDLDGIDSIKERVELSIYYHLIEKDIFKSLYDKSKDSDDYYNYAISLRQLGLRYEEIYQYDKALMYFKDVYHIVKELDINIYRDSYIIALEHLGNIYFLLEDYPNAKKYYDKVYLLEDEDKDKSIEDLFSVAIILKKLAKVYQRLKDYDNALINFNKSLDIVKSVSDKNNDYTYQSELGIAYMNIGWIYMERKEYLNAYKYFEKDLYIREKLYNQYLNKTSHYSYSLALRHMGYVNEELDNSECISYFKKCYHISSYYGNNSHAEGELHYLAVSTHDLAYSLKKFKYYNEAKEYYEKVLDYFKKHKESYRHEYVLNENEINSEYNELLKFCKKEL